MNPDAPPVDGLIDAIHQQHWPIVVGFVIAILIYAANHAGLQDRVGAKWIPRIAMGSGILSAIGAQLVLGIPWEEAVSKGFLAGATATGLWETLLKDMLPKVPARAVTPAPAAAEAEAPKAATPKAAKAAKVVVPEAAPAAEVPAKVKKKPGPKPGSKRVKAETVVGAPVTPEAAPVTPETTPATVEEPKAPEVAAEAPVSPPAEPTP
jgi:hypothetical protein